MGAFLHFVDYVFYVFFLIRLAARNSQDRLLARKCELEAARSYLLLVHDTFNKAFRPTFDCYLRYREQFLGLPHFSVIWTQTSMSQTSYQR